jgi:hypothetical protein
MFVRAGRVGDGNVVVRSYSLRAARHEVRRVVEWRLCEWCDRIIAPRQPNMAYAIGCLSRALAPKNLVFDTVLHAVFSAFAMGFLCDLLYAFIA